MGLINIEVGSCKQHALASARVLTRCRKVDERAYNQHQPVDIYVGEHYPVPYLVEHYIYINRNIIYNYIYNIYIYIYTYILILYIK